MRVKAWMPLALLSVLIVGLGAYAAVSQDAFLTKYNLGNLLLTTLPLALVSIGQTATLRTADTQIVVEAAASAPRLVSLQIPGQAKWEDRVSEPLIEAIEIAGKSTPLRCPS